MQIDELLILEQWFQKQVKKLQIPQKYQQLHAVMQQNANIRNNQPRTPFDTQTSELLNALSSVKFNTLSIEQINLLIKLEIKELLGDEGVEKVEEILYKNQLDIVAASQKIGENLNKINQAVTRFDQVKSTFSGLYTIDETEEIPEGNVLMRVYFQGNSSMKNIIEFKRLGNQWYEIGRGIAMASNGSPENLQIIGAHKGSVILELAVIAGVATSISTILLGGLKVAEKSIDILKKVEELKSLKLSNKKIVNELEKEATKEKQEGIKKIVDEAIKRHALDSKTEGDKINALEKAVTNLINFTENGGKVDFIQPKEEENINQDNLVEFRNNCKQIRLIEAKIQYIEHKENE